MVLSIESLHRCAIIALSKIKHAIKHVFWGNIEADSNTSNNF